MSKNNKFVAFHDKVYKRYTKAVPSIVTGLRLNPVDQTQMDFTLTSSERYYKYITRPDNTVTIKQVGIDQENAVIEIYSAIEDGIFKRLNRKLFESGVLVEYTQYQDNPLSEENALTNEQVKELINLKAPAFKKKIETVTSVLTLERILEQCVENDKPISFSRAIEARIAVLKDDN